MEKFSNKKEISFAAAAGIIVLYIVHSMMGFRWASVYVCTNHIITWKYGYLPRGLANNIAALFMGENLYSYQALNILILGAAGLFLIYMIATVIQTVAVKRNLICFVIFFAFAVSPYAKYFLHEAGYYEQYGFLLGILLIEVALRKNAKVTCVCAALFSVLSVLVSESNLFLVVPFLFSIAFLQLQQEKNVGLIKNAACLILAFLPAVLYSIAAFFMKIPKERMDKILEWDRAHADFILRTDVYEYFWNDRSNADIWGRQLHSIPVECVIYPLLFVFMISFFVYQINKHAALSYLILSILCGIANYSIVIVAWDLDRYYFCIFMQIFIMTIYMIKKYLKNYKIRGEGGSWLYVFCS